MCLEVTCLREGPKPRKKRSGRGPVELTPAHHVRAHWPELRTEVLAALRREFQNQKPVLGTYDSLCCSYFLK